MSGGRIPSRTNSGASSIRGRRGISARAMPAMTRRIEGAVLNRRATTATTTRTAINSRSVWIVAVTGHTLLGRGALPFRIGRDRLAGEKIIHTIAPLEGATIRKVKSQRSVMRERCPLYPRKRTNGRHVGMSASCHKRTHAVQQKSSLIDHPVGALLKLRRHLGAESLGRFDKFEF